MGECIGSAADKFCAYFKEIKIITRELSAMAAPFLRLKKFFEKFLKVANYGKFFVV